MKLTCLEFLASMVMCILSSLSLILYKLGFRIEAFALTGYQMYLKHKDELEEARLEEKHLHSQF